MSAKVILYDIPSQKPQHCWSVNPWKTRLILNYKKIEYETKWLEYPDIAPTLRSLGIPPNDPDEQATYSSPAITLEASKQTLHIMNSKNIAPALDAHFPSPPLHLDSPLVGEVFAILGQLFSALAPTILPKLPRTVLNPVSAAYFERTRAAVYGMPLAELEARKGGEQAWAAAEEPIGKMAALLRKDAAGPFFEGEERTYADIVFVAFLRFLKSVDEEGLWRRFLAVDEGFGRLYEAWAEYLERDDY